MAILTAEQPVSACLSTPDLVAIAQCSTTRDELDEYLDHLDECPLCTCIVARLLGRPLAASGAGGDVVTMALFLVAATEAVVIGFLAGKMYASNRSFRKLLDLLNAHSASTKKFGGGGGAPRPTIPRPRLVQ